MKVDLKEVRNGPKGWCPPCEIARTPRNQAYTNAFSSLLAALEQVVHPVKTF